MTTIQYNKFYFKEPSIISEETYAFYKNELNKNQKTTEKNEPTKIISQ
jgi:hypothetical protein